MANGKSHTNAINKLTVTLGLSAALIVSLVGNVYILRALAWVCIGCQLGLYLNPDLDLADRKRTPLPVKRWGLLAFMWVPYAKMIPMHRSRFSHWPILSDAIRVIYLVIMMTPVSFMLGFTWSMHDLVYLFTHAFTICTFIGLCLVTFLHLYQDNT